MHDEYIYIIRVEMVDIIIELINRGNDYMIQSKNKNDTSYFR